mmetsp:Transcript_1386/g.2861  ORF Transcript_1386/g.2861 Transcript_1386/m.2861 type:complete len:233 (-) Transcript_1386:131-829(-)
MNLSQLLCLFTEHAYAAFDIVPSTTLTKAGCILVDFEKMQVINRSPAYRNQYIHRRDSISLTGMDPADIDTRARLGLVTDLPVECQYQEEESDDGLAGHEEEWEEDDDDYEDDLENEMDEDDEGTVGRYVLDTRRSSSVDPTTTVSSPESSMRYGVNTKRGAGGNGMAALSPLKESFKEGEEEDDETSTVDAGEGDIENWEGGGENGSLLGCGTWRRMRASAEGDNSVEALS